LTNRKFVLDRQRSEVELLGLLKVGLLADVFCVEITAIHLAIPFDRRHDFARGFLSGFFSDRLSQPRENLIVDFRTRLEFRRFWLRAMAALFRPAFQRSAARSPSCRRLCYRAEWLTAAPGPCAVPARCLFCRPPRSVLR